MAMECSVTVSIGEETRGVLREIRLVTGVSRATSAAENPDRLSQEGCRCRSHEGCTNVARKYQEIIISQTAIDTRVQ